MPHPTTPPGRGAAPRLQAAATTILGSRIGLWVAFAIVHVGLAVWGIGPLRQSAFWDVEIYRYWIEVGLNEGLWPVLDYPWVYPVLALAPMASAWLLSGGGPLAYLVAWVAQVAVLNAGALALLTRPHGALLPRRRAALESDLPAGFNPDRHAGPEPDLEPAPEQPHEARETPHERSTYAPAPSKAHEPLGAPGEASGATRSPDHPAAAPTGPAPMGALLPGWYWLAFLALLGTVSIARIDAIAAPFTLLALLAATHWPGRASALASFGAWIKVFPGAVFAVLALTHRAWPRVLAVGVALSSAIAAVVVASGGGGNLFAFLAGQTGRGLQLESVLGTPFVVWNSLNHRPAGVYNADLNTVEIPGAASQLVAALANVLLVALVLVVAYLIWRARSHPATVLIGSLALTTALIVGNKVGSPQFLCALAPIVVVALRAPTQRRAWRPAAIGLLALAGLTQLVFPHLYGELQAGNGLAVCLLTVRNVGLVALLGWALFRLAHLVRAARATQAGTNQKPPENRRESAS